MNTPPERLQAALTALRWSPATLGSLRVVHERQARRMLAGEASIDPCLLDWLEFLASYHKAFPWRPGWGQRPESSGENRRDSAKNRLTPRTNIGHKSVAPGIGPGGKGVRPNGQDHL